MRCENCGREHNGNYGSGRFCSQKCARGFSSKHVTEEGRKKQKEVLNSKENRKKAHNTILQNSDNYELDSDGRWQRVKKHKDPRFKDNKERHKKSSMLGKVGELATVKKFIEHGYDVYIPVLDNCGTDMIVEKDDGPKKIQVKSSSRSSNDNDENSTVFSLKSNVFNIKGGKVTTYNKKYTKQNVDYFALYSAIDNDVYLIENNEKQGAITIRNKIDPDNLTTKGKNLEKIHMAEDYQIDKVLNDIDYGIKQPDIIIDDGSFIDISDN